MFFILNDSQLDSVMGDVRGHPRQAQVTAVHHAWNTAGVNIMQKMWGK